MEVMAAPQASRGARPLNSFRLHSDQFINTSATVELLISLEVKGTLALP